MKSARRYTGWMKPVYVNGRWQITRKFSYKTRRHGNINLKSGGYQTYILTKKR